MPSTLFFLRLSVYFESRVLQNYLKTYTQNAGNRVSEVSDFRFQNFKNRANSLICNSQILG